MHAFTFSLFARYPDSIVTPLKGCVDAPISDGGEFYTCALDCPLVGGGGQFRSRYPEWAYAQALSWLRMSFEGQGFEVCGPEGRVADIAAPVTDEYGIPCFAPARFRGRVLHGGELIRFSATVRPPERNADGLWACAVNYSPYGELGPVRSHWPEHAYQLAFAFLRNLVDYRGEGKPVGMNGAPLVIHAPVRPPRRR
jgi:hypothetical protein